MRKVLLLLVMFILSSPLIFAQDFPETSWRDQADTLWYDDSLSSFDIATPEEFAGLSALVETGNTFKNKTINIVADLNLDGHLWIPIGKDNDFPFSGTVEGNNHVISNLWITGLNKDFIGLFGQTVGATFKDITLDTANIDDIGEVSGSLVANMFTDGLMENCHARNVEIHIQGPSIGGLVGGVLTDSYLVRCSFSGNVSGENQVGGLASQIWDHCGISECYAEGTVTGTYIVGGLVGFGTTLFVPNRESTVEDSYSRMNVVATDPVGMAGGIYGAAQVSVIIKNVYSTGTVEAMNAAGAFIGEAFGITVENCFYDMEASGMDTAVGATGPDSDFDLVIEAKNTEEMTNAEFANTLNQGEQNGPWAFDPDLNDAYPFLGEVPLSMDAFDKNEEVMIYPSLVEQYFTIQTESQFDRYKIFGLSGQLVVEGQLNGLQNTVEAGNLNSGVYLIQITGAKGTLTKRIIKK